MGPSTLKSAPLSSADCCPGQWLDGGFWRCLGHCRWLQRNDPVSPFSRQGLRILKRSDQLFACVINVLPSHILWRIGYGSAADELVWRRRLMQGLPLRTPGVQVISSLLVVTIPASSMTLKLQPWRLVAPSPSCRSSKAASPPAPSRPRWRSHQGHLFFQLILPADLLPPRAGQFAPIVEAAAQEPPCPGHGGCKPVVVRVLVTT
jgi:hypothetical protein